VATVPHAGRVDARTVLLADDDEDFRIALAEALDADGYEVVVVPSGAAALAVLEDAAKGRAHPPDLLVLRFFSADPTPIEGVATVIVKNERPGSSSTYTLSNGPSTIYADRGTGVSFCAISGTSGLQPLVVELHGLDGCLLATTSTMAYVLADITALDLVFSSRGCLGDAGLDATP
jgi:CheY-like chemotaxis protein